MVSAIHCSRLLLCLSFQALEITASRFSAKRSVFTDDTKHFVMPSGESGVHAASSEQADSIIDTHVNQSNASVHVSEFPVFKVIFSNSKQKPELFQNSYAATPWIQPEEIGKDTDLSKVWMYLSGNGAFLRLKGFEKEIWLASHSVQQTGGPCNDGRENATQQEMIYETRPRHKKYEDPKYEDPKYGTPFSVNHDFIQSILRTDSRLRLESAATPKLMVTWYGKTNAIDHRTLLLGKYACPGGADEQERGLTIPLDFDSDAAMTENPEWKNVKDDLLLKTLHYKDGNGYIEKANLYITYTCKSAVEINRIAVKLGRCVEKGTSEAESTTWRDSLPPTTRLYGGAEPFIKKLKAMVEADETYAERRKYLYAEAERWKAEGDKDVMYFVLSQQSWFLNMQPRL